MSGPRGEAPDLPDRARARRACVAPCVPSPTSTVPGVATDWRRDAVLTIMLDAADIEVAGWAENARVIFTRLGAAPMLERLLEARASAG